MMSPIGCFGGSLTYGGDAAGTGQAANPYPKILQAALGRLVYNGGIAGETSTQIRQCVTTADFFANGVEIFMAGKNNVSAPATVLADIAQAVAWNKSGKYIVIGVTPTAGTDDQSGTPNYDNRMTINAGLQSA